MDVRLSVFVATILVAGLPVGPAFGQGASVRFLGLSIFTADRAYILRYFLCDPVTVAEARPVFAAGPGQAGSSGDLDFHGGAFQSATSAPCHDAISAPHPRQKDQMGLIKSRCRMSPR